MENQKTGLLKSWVQVPQNSDFTIYNLPFGIFRNKRLSPRAGIAIGDKIVDLSALQEAGFLSDIKLSDDIFLQEFLNPFIGLGKPTTKKVRERVQQLLNEDNSDLKDHQARGKIMVGLKEAEMMMPVAIGNYTGFVSPSEQGMMEGGAHIHPPINGAPFGYHGRSSSVVLSGTGVYRPKGPIRSQGSDRLDFGPSKKLDFEMEIAFVVGRNDKMGESIGVNEAEEYLFGMVMLNDWTARDIQEGEGGPFVPFSSKNFASSISPWIVTLDALEDFKTKSRAVDQDLLPYLQGKDLLGYDIALEAYRQPAKGEEKLLCRSNFRHAPWSVQQLLAQQTINGCTIEIGDLIASGAISNPDDEHFSSIVEMAKHQGATAEDEILNTYIKDGDTVVLRGFCERDGVRVGFGEVSTKILPTR